MNDKVEILTKVYGFVNRIKVCLALKDIAGIWKVVNEISEYLVSVDCTPTPRAPDLLDAPACCASFVFDGTHHRDCRFAKSASG